MRFMMMVIPEGYQDAAPGTVPDDAEAVKKMMDYNEALQKAGVLLDLNGLHPPSMGFRVSYSGGKPSVTDGPFTEAKEVVGGYWLIDVASSEEALEWAKRAPMGDSEIIEVRRVQELSDFPEDVREVAAGLEGMREQAAGPEEG